jgi:hypothetical protein
MLPKAPILEGLKHELQNSVMIKGMIKLIMGAAVTISGNWSMIKPYIFYFTEKCIILTQHAGFIDSYAKCNAWAPF